jgi:hypothetical protein
MEQSPGHSRGTEGTSSEAVHDQPPGISLTLAEAADACGVGRGAIYRWLDGVGAENSSGRPEQVFRATRSESSRGLLSVPSSFER